MFNQFSIMYNSFKRIKSTLLEWALYALSKYMFRIFFLTYGWVCQEEILEGTESDFCTKCSVQKSYYIYFLIFWIFKYYWEEQKVVSQNQNLMLFLDVVKGSGFNSRSKRVSVKNVCYTYFWISTNNSFMLYN